MQFSFCFTKFNLNSSQHFIFFAFSFFKPQTARDWRAFGAFGAFVVALFVEMYGFPLTIYLLSGWLQSRFPDVDWFSHDAGHLLEMIFGWKVNHAANCDLTSQGPAITAARMSATPIRLPSTTRPGRIRYM